MTTIYCIEAENGDVKYWYDYLEIVNSFVNIGLDCSVYKVNVPDSVELDEHIDSEYLDNLDWEYISTFHA